MPQTPVVLDKNSHAALTFASVEDYSFTATMSSIPLLAFEVVQAAACFAIIFPEPDSATPHALLGLGEKNIFVNARGRWLAPYLPLLAANYPFSVARAMRPAFRHGPARSGNEKAPARQYGAELSFYDHHVHSPACSARRKRNDAFCANGDHV